MRDLASRGAWLLGFLLPLAMASGCGGSSRRGAGAGSPSAGGAGGSGGSGAGGSGAGTSAPPAGLPVPPGSGDLAPPSGAAAGLRVLPWAGFASAVSYTIDDSQPSQVDHYAELAAEGVRMTFYVNPSGNGYAGYDSTFQSAIAAGHEIGNHTMNHCHPDLTGCNTHLPTLEQEVDQCSSYIVTNLAQGDVWTFAYPYGDTGYATLARSRFFLARGVGGGTVGAGDTTDPFNLPIFGAVGGETAEALNSRIDAASTQGRWLLFLFHSILPTTQNWYAGVEIASITGSIQHAKSLGTVWLDSVVNVGAYWLGQRTFESVAPASVNTETTFTWSLPASFPRGHVLRVTVDGGTLSQGGAALVWDGHGYYEVALDAGTLTWTP